ncbi:MAG: hypothetical protein JWN70_2569 [Planctomycetaceae bacterium]|nr:hypothetical protein [Planctomycetaceae bacterium]
MSALPFDLQTLQTWMQAVLMETDTSQRIEDVITASEQQTSRERFHVYANAYQARLVDCLREEFATLCKFLDQDVFDGLATAYLQAHPSQSYTLADLGKQFPQFMSETAAALADVADGESESDGTGTQFLVDLATLERLYAEVFDGPGIEGLPLITPDELKNIGPEAWPQVRFEAAPCWRLIEFAYPVHEFVTACRHGTEPPIPEPRHTWLAVTRRQYIVRRVSLTEKQFRLLSLLSQGLPLGEALDTVAASCEDVDAFAKDIQQWFQEWTTSGFFLRIRQINAQF